MTINVQTPKSKIIAVGSYLPQKVLTNDEIAKMVDTSDEWVFTRTGIKERHIAAEDEFTSDLATKAAQKLLSDYSIAASSLDAIIVATVSPDYTFPAVATQVHNQLGCLTTCFAFDIEAACAGLLTAMATANGFIASGLAQRVLIIGAECFSKFINWTDRATCVLFGDGASALLLEATSASDNRGLIGVKLWTEGSLGECLKSTGGVCTTNTAGHIFMNGQTVFKNAVLKMIDSIEYLLETYNVSKEVLKFIVPHQANDRIIKSIQEKLELDEKKVISTVRNHANTSAASLGLALDTLVQNKQLQAGDLVALSAIGAGLTWGSALIRW